MKLTLLDKRDINDESISPDQIKRKKMFNLEDLIEIKVLGQGSFGKVKLIKNQKTNQYFAMKCLFKEHIRGKK